MIKKYIQFNEGISQYLKGPTKEEIWKYLGYDRIFDTPEEFFNYFKNGIEIKPSYQPDSVYWVKNGKIIFKLNKLSGYMYMCEELITVFKKLFNIGEEELRTVLFDFIGEELNWKGKHNKFYPSYLRVNFNNSILL